LKPLEKKTALVVGASSGMGRATASALAAEGARVMAAARRIERLRTWQDEMRGRGAEVDSRMVDVTDRARVDRLIAETLDRFGAIDLMVYAAGTNIPERSMELLTEQTWDMMIATNLTGAFHCTKAVLPSMRNAESGLIIYISSIAAHLFDAASGASYQASKAGLAGLAHATRLEEKKNGIRTSLLLPGLCRTDLMQKRPTPPPKEILDLALEPEDVAQAVVAIASLPPRAVVPEMELLPSRV
jgi:NADP-dependent 3-hydroxy acid dehydrogenase YdfG